MNEPIIIAALLTAGLLMILLEILTPTFGVLTGLAIVCFTAGIWMAYSISSLVGLLTLLGTLVLVPVYCVVLVKRLPRSRLGRKLFLGDAAAGTGQAQPEASQYSALVGKTGEAESTLRPSGTVRIAGRRYYARAESGQIEQGRAVRVVRFDGMDIIVRAVEDSPRRGDA